MASMEEITINLTYYRLNANSQDPMYLYMLDQYIKKKSEIKFDFALFSNEIISDRSVPLSYGSIPCHTPGREAYMDSVFSCALFQLPFLLENINFGFICMSLAFVILFISLFGGIKENYRWFLLNQAIWDIFVCYDFICEKPTLIAWSNLGILSQQNQTTCLYTNNFLHKGYNTYVTSTIQTSVRCAPFFPFLLLACFRYICVYFPNFYQKFAKPYKIGIILIFCNILFVLFANSMSVFEFIKTPIINGYLKSCFDIHCTNITDATICMKSNEKYFQCANYYYIISGNLSMFARHFQHAFSPASFFLAIIFVILLITKILRQLKYQLKHANNKESINQSIRIASVVAIQCLTSSVILVITVIQMYGLSSAWQFNDFTVYKNMSHFIFLLQHYGTTSSLNLVRTSIDSVIVLVILSGYRNSLFQTFKFFFLCFIKPKSAFQKFLQYFGKRNNQTFVSSTTILINKK